jgi:hypothetical protein
MRIKPVIISPFVLIAILVGQAMAQLFYDNCSGDECRKGYIEKKEKVGEDLYLIKTIFLTYHKRGTTNADEENRNARISCNKARPTLIWGSGKEQIYDNRAFVRLTAKNRRRVVDSDRPEALDETTSLWKKVCITH